MDSARVGRKQGLTREGPGLTINNAQSYLEELERELPAVKFNKFLGIIDDFQAQRMSTQEVVTKVQSILEGKPPSLITGFNMFLPAEFHIKPQKFDVAMMMVKKIRSRYEKSEPKVLSQFVEILARFQEDAISLQAARTRVKQLFKAQQDLIADFDAFLPSPVDSPTPTPTKKVGGAGKEREKEGGKGLGSAFDKPDKGAKAGGLSGMKRKPAQMPVREEGGHAKAARGAEESSSPATAHRRRLPNVTRPPASSVPSGPQRARKQAQPQRLRGAAGEGCVQGQRKKLFRMGELAAVLPLTVLQRAQTMLRQIHS